MLTAQRKEEIVHLCQELVRIPSYSGQEGDVAQAIRSIMGKLGFDDIRVDEYGNVTGGIKGIRPGKRLVLDGHIDTVPVEDASVWSKDPFGGILENGRIYGRGTSDMKGAVAAMLAAVGFFGADKKRDFSGSVYVACVVHEECFEGVAARSVSQQLKPDCVIIGECSELNLKKGQRGRAEIVLETFGRPAHSANPEAGRNAVYAMAQLIERIRELPMTAHPVLGKGILELTDIKSAPYPGASVVPEYCRATYDRRLLVGETPESVLQPLQELVTAWNAQQDGLSAKVSYAKGRRLLYRIYH
jgi:putative selenium metabolism hydrolase